MSKKRELSSDEKKLWRRVAAGVKSHRVTPGAAGQGEPEIERRTRAVKSTIEPARKSPPVAPPADRGGEKRVRRGKLEIGASLDLHGHTRDSARAALGRFLRAAQKRGHTTVIVVTGVGRAGVGVLKRRLPEWLTEPDLRALITGYAQAHRAHGGAGAFYVFVRRAA